MAKSTVALRVYPWIYDEVAKIVNDGRRTQAEAMDIYVGEKITAVTAMYAKNAELQEKNEEMEKEIKRLVDENKRLSREISMKQKEVKEWKKEAMRYLK